MFYSGTKFVAQNIRNFIERVLRATQRCLGATCNSMNTGWEPLI